MEQYLFLKTIMVSGVKMIRIYTMERKAEKSERKRIAQEVEQCGAMRSNAEQLPPIKKKGMS